MTPGIANVFWHGFTEPVVSERMGTFQNVQIPVQKTSGPANWWVTSPDKAELVIPQTQKEHDDLLNKYYHTRETNPMWKEMGRAAEKDSPHYNDKDNKIRGDLGARSSFVTDIVYDPNTQRAMVQLGGGKYYTYDASPEQLKAFLKAGSLGKEINRIKHGQGSSLRRSSARQQPNRTGLNIRSMFGV